MKRLTFLSLCLAGGLALADENNDTPTESLIDEVEIRLSEMEQIDVTAEKAPAKSTEALDSEIESILDEAEALEAEDES